MAGDPALGWRQAIAAASRLGDQLLAFDLSRQALADCPDRIEFEYTALLALARSGVTEAARRRLAGLCERIARLEDAGLARDFAALRGRLWKDQAVRSGAETAVACWRQAAEAYEAAYLGFGGAFPAINAATCHLAAGGKQGALRFAGIALEQADGSAADYWAMATRIEALLILGRAAEAEDVARALPAATRPDEVASTRRQLGLVVGLTGAAFDLALLPAPRVLAWPSAVRPVTEAQARALLGAEGAIVFLPLLTAGDLATAGSLVAAGAALRVVMPCAPELWLASVFGGAGLEGALRAVLAVGEPLLVTGEGGVDEPAARLLCQRQAVGLARLRAQALAVTAEIVAEDGPSEGEAPAGLVRHPCAILFGDVRGFSKLGEAGQLRFLETVIGGFADVLEATPGVEYAETAGDGLFVVLSDVAAAAGCCFALRAVLDPVGLAAAGLPAHLALRLSAHVGPLHRRHDRVIRRDKFCGMEVIRTARIEPVTPVGEIFVTEQFAATLAAEGDAFVCEYVGRQAMAKGFGDCRMYSLRRAQG